MEFKLDKLVRDNIPEILRGKGIKVHDEVLDDSHYIEALKAKLVEEVDELRRASSAAELIEELADVQEVLRAFAKASGISIERLEDVRRAKKKLKGGFDRKIYISSVEKKVEFETHSNCLFCQIAKQERAANILQRFKHCFVLKDEYPVSEGHILIIPNVHTENWFTATEEVRLDILQALHVMKEYLDRGYQPQGYNIGANCGEIAGQSVMHLHVHLIPRYRGDMDDPKGGVRGVIPSKQKY